MRFAEEPLRNFQWSSFPEYGKLPARRADWLRVDRLFGEMGIPQDSTAGQREFERRTEERRAQEQAEKFKGIRRGWCFGDEQFRKELLAQMSEKIGKYHYGPEVQETAEEQAERMVATELRRRKWTEESLSQKRKGDAGKVEMAVRLRAETTMTLEWIAQRLQMGTKTHLAHLLYWRSRK